MTLASLTTFSPLRIRSAETPPKLERKLTPGREMTREERKVARRRDGGGLDTAYVAKRMTFKLPSFIGQSQPPIKLPVSSGIADLSLESLKQAGPPQVSLPALTASTSKSQPNAKSSLSSSQSQSRATSENPKSHSLTTKSKGRLSNEALAKGWGIETSHKRVSSHGTRVTRPSLEASSSGSSNRRGRPEPPYDDEAASSAAPLVSAKAGSNTADQGFKQGSNSKKALPAQTKSRTAKSHSIQSADTDIISQKDQPSKAVDENPVGSTGFKATPAMSPHSPTSNLSTSSETPNKRNITEFSKDSSAPLRNANRKKRRLSQPTHDDTQLSEANKDLASLSTDHSQPKAHKDESRTNKIYSKLQPPVNIDAKSHNISSSTSRTTTLTQKEKMSESIKIPNLPKRGIEANQSNMPWKPLDSVNSPVTPAYAKAFPSLTSTLQRTITSPADHIVNRRISTQLSDITNTIHSARPPGTLLTNTNTQTSKNPRNEVVRASKTAKKGKVKLDPMVESLEQEEPLTLSNRGKTLEEQHQQASSSDSTQVAKRTSTNPRTSIHGDMSASDAARVPPSQHKGRSVSKDIRKQNRSESPDTVDSDVGIHRAHVERSTSLDAVSASGSTTNKRSMDPTPKWSALNTEVPQPKKLKKLAHKVFTPAKPSGPKGVQPDEVPHINHTMQSTHAKNVCNEDELYVVTDRFVDEEDFEDLEPNQSNENSKLLTKIKNQLNPPDIVWISIRRLLQDEIDDLQKTHEIENDELKEKECLEKVYDRFKLQMMEYSEEIIKHGLLKLKLQKLIEQEKKEKKSNGQVQDNGVSQSSTLKNQGLDEKPEQIQLFKKDKKINVSAEVDDLPNKPSKPIKPCKPNNNRGKANAKTKKAR